MKPSASRLAWLFLVPAAALVLVIITWESGSVPGHHDSVATDLLASSIRANTGTAASPEKSATPPTTGALELDARISQISKPVTRQELLVELHLLDQWSAEGEDRITSRSENLTSPSGEKSTVRSYRAEPYEGVKSITIRIDSDPGMKCLIVETGDRMETYQWDEGAFRKYSPAAAKADATASYWKKQSGMKRWAHDFFSLFQKD